MKKAITLILALVMTVTAFTACGGKDEESAGVEGAEITVISREEGSGTRDAFTELMGIKVDDKDNTVNTAEVSSSTSVVITTVAGNENAVGYVSLGSLNDSVKAIKVDGVDPTVENIKNGSYAVARPFNVVTKGDLSAAAEDFLDFIMSSEGQKIVADEGYIAIAEDAASYEQKSGISGRITLGGSTSVAPLMDVLADAYKQIYPDVEIEIQQTGSGAGITSAIEGAVDIGMSSRDLKEEELSQGLTATKIAMDGIAVIVNKANGVDGLTSEEIRSIFTGERTTW